MTEELRKNLMRFKRICFAFQTVNSDIFDLWHHLTIKLDNQITLHNIIVSHVSSPIEIKSKINDHFLLINPISDKIITALLEAYCGNIYSTMEVFAAIIKECFLIDRKNQIPEKFNAIIKKTFKNKLDNVDKDFAKYIKENVEWYEKAHEIRTEWTHYSSIFMGIQNGEKVVKLDILRRLSDKKHYTKSEGTLMAIDEILSFWGSMIDFIANVGNYMGDKYLIPKLDLGEVKLWPVNNSATGFVIDSEGIKMKEVTIGDFIEKGNIED